ncbi:hypothetical protein A2U01_0079305, partial [Trifolium medium]|nr:hypothetical protein [Trifolium medium]
MLCSALLRKRGQRGVPQGALYFKAGTLITLLLGPMPWPKNLLKWLLKTLKSPDMFAAKRAR